MDKRDKVITFLIIIAVCFAIPVVIGFGFSSLEASGAGRSLMMAWNGAHDGAVGFWREVVMNEKIRALLTTTHTQSEILDGNHYYIEGWVELDNGQELFVQMLPPNSSSGKVMHLTWKIESGGVLETYMIEEATGGMAGGAAVTPLNSDRNSGNVSHVRLWNGVTTATSSGATVANAKVGSAGFKGSVGGDPSRGDMLVMKSGVTYMRAFKSFTDDNFISFRAGWDEHENFSK